MVYTESRHHTNNESDILPDMFKGLYCHLRVRDILRWIVKNDTFCLYREKYVPT